jgi:hypothetical protein
LRFRTSARTGVSIGAQLARAHALGLGAVEVGKRKSFAAPRSFYRLANIGGVGARLEIRPLPLFRFDKRLALTTLMFPEGPPIAEPPGNTALEQPFYDPGNGYN